MDKEFERTELETILHQIASHLYKKIAIFLFGGAVMVYNNLKPSTKDIDILFESKEDYDHFLEAAKKAGFVRQSVPLAYEHFDISTMLANPKTDWRLDLFLHKVCKKFCFNLDVKARSRLFATINNLYVHFISLEDIFLMKSLTQRKRDLDDMNTLLGFGLDFNTITREINNQKEHEWDIIERLLEFEELYHIKLSLPTTVRKKYQKRAQEKITDLLKKQANTMLDEGKNKQEIMKHFKLSEKQWKKLNLP